MNDDLRKLMEQRAQLDSQISELTQRGKMEALAKIKELANAYGFTSAELARLGSFPVGNNSYKQPIAPKYRDPATGNTWSGRGKRPNWLSAALKNGGNMSGFLIGATPPAPAPIPAPAVKRPTLTAKKTAKKK